MKNKFLLIIFNFCLVSLVAAQTNFNCSVIESVPVGCTDLGSIQVVVENGVPPYTYNLVGIAQNQTGLFENLLIGTYSVTVIDANGDVTQCSGALGLSNFSCSIQCTEASDELEVIGSEGVPPYSYAWSNGASGAIAENLDQQQMYFVTITDSNGCTTSCNYFLGGGDNLVCNEDVFISLNSDGRAVLSPTMITEQPFNVCSNGFEMNLTDMDGNEILPYAQSLNLDCSHLGNWVVNARETSSGQSCSVNISVEDKSPPLALCISQSTALMENGMVELWAVDFSIDSWDNCSSLRYTFTSIPPEEDPNFDDSLSSSFKIFDCDDILLNGGDNVAVEVYVWDDAGNFSFCVVNVLLLEDEDSPCLLEGSFIQVVSGICNGYTFTLNNDTQLEPDVCAHAMDSEDLVVGTNEVSISDIDDILSLAGVSTLDIVLIQKHMLEFSELDSPFDIVAADWDGDGALSTYDLLAIRRVILGIDQGNDVNHFKVLRDDFEFDTDFSAFNIPTEVYSFTFEDSEVDNQVLPVRVIKSGDVNGSFFAPHEDDMDTRSLSTLEFQDVQLMAGQQYQIDFTLKSALLNASTFALDFDHANILSIDGDDAQALLSSSEESKAKISILTGSAVDAFNFSITIESNNNALLSDIISLDNEFLNEVVSTGLEMGQISLKANALTSNEDLDAVSLKVFPNPVNDELNIALDGFGNSDVQIEFISIDGQLMYSENLVDQNTNVAIPAYLSNGAYFLRVISEHHSLVKQVVILR